MSHERGTSASHSCSTVTPAGLRHDAARIEFEWAVYGSNATRHSKSGQEFLESLGWSSCSRALAGGNGKIWFITDFRGSAAAMDRTGGPSEISQPQGGWNRPPWTARPGGTEDDLHCPSGTRSLLAPTRHWRVWLISRVASRRICPRNSAKNHKKGGRSRPLNSAVISLQPIKDRPAGSNAGARTTSSCKGSWSR
jgi:hypothetical protein